MTSRRTPAAVALCAAVGLALAIPALHAQAQRRVIYASALDAKGMPVPSLSPADVVVREDRVTREVLDVAPATDPMTIALLVDNSQAADPFIRDIREAL